MASVSDSLKNINERSGKDQMARIAEKTDAILSVLLSNQKYNKAKDKRSDLMKINQTDGGGKKEKGGGILGAITGAITRIADGIADFFKNWGNPVVVGIALGLGIAAALIPVLLLLYILIKKGLEGIPDLIVSAANTLGLGGIFQLIETLVSIIQKIADILLEGITFISQILRNTFASLADKGLFEVLMEILTAIPKLAGAFVVGLIDQIDLIVTKMIRLIPKIVKEVVLALIDTIEGVFSSIFGAAGQAFSFVKGKLFGKKEEERPAEQAPVEMTAATEVVAQAAVQQPDLFVPVLAKLDTIASTMVSNVPALIQNLTPVITEVGGAVVKYVDAAVQSLIVATTEQAAALLKKVSAIGEICNNIRSYQAEMLRATASNANRRSGPLIAVSSGSNVNLDGFSDKLFVSLGKHEAIIAETNGLIKDIKTAIENYISQQEMSFSPLTMPQTTGSA